MKRFGSVPDLRGRDRDRESTPEHVSRESREYANRARKKYKAPPPPQNGNAMVINNNYNIEVNNLIIFYIITDIKWIFFR